MKTLCFAAILLSLPSIVACQVLYNEDFNLPDGTTNDAGSTAWSTSYSGGGDFETASGVFYIHNLDSEGVWTSQSIDISSYGYAVIDIAGYIIYASSDDYLRFYYSVDGGPEILFGDFSGGLLTGAVGASSIVSGNSLVVTVRAYNNVFFWENFYFDDVVVTGVTTLYSRASAAWNTSGTWSTVALGGASCACTPNDKTRVIVGAGYAVTIDGAGTTEAIDLIIQNGGSVTFGATEDLDIHRGGSVIVEGVLNSDTYTAAQLDFEGAYTNVVTINGSLTIGDIDVNDAAIIPFSGAGALNVQDDILISSSAQLTNSMAGSFAVGGDIQFETDASSAEFINNQALTVTGNLSYQNDLNTFSNAGSVTFANIAAGSGDDNCQLSNSGIVNFQSVDTNNANFIISNSGTINQSGNFIDGEIDTGSSYTNSAGSVWTWSLTPNTTYDTDVATVFNLTASGNTFNYSGAGAQRIIPTTYYHITLSNSGAKDANSASFSVGGNWTHSGTATFTTAGGTITFNGTAAQTITPAAAGISFRGLTFNNSFGASPQITLNGNVTAVTTLTMSDGNINLNGNTVTIGASAGSPGTLSHAGASTNGWMYGGNLIRYMATAATTIGGGDQNEGFFPLGSAADFRPFYIGKSNTANSGGAITVSHTNSTSTSDVSIADTNPVATITRRHDSFWTVSISGPAAGSWNLRAGGTNFGTIQETADLRMSTSTGVVGTNSAATGSVSDPRVNRTGLTFGQLTNNFHVASTDATNSPLPIELISFSAQLRNNEVEINWSTASETNNDYFTIERATNLEHFKPIHKEKGKGTTKEKSNYKALDPAPLSGRSYYRLKQTDFDGKFSYSELRVIDYDGPQFATLTAFPTPTQGQNLTIQINGLGNSTHVPVQVLNMQGQIVYNKVIEVTTTPGLVSEEIPAGTFPAPGLYIIKAGETIHLTKKIVVE